MDKNLKKDIPKVLYEKGYAFEFNALKQELQNKYGHERRVEGQLDIFSSEVMHILEVFAGAGLVQKQIGSTGTGRMSTFYSLTDKGYQLFDSWYKKAWRFFTTDMAKLLSVIAIILSIIATIVSMLKNN